MYLLRSLLSCKSHIRQYINCRHMSYSAIKLTNRKMIRITGDDSIIYIQSLITNDVRHLLTDENVHQRNCIYAFMLSSLGRVLCELILYKGKIRSEGELLIEIDSRVANAMKRFLWGYSINRKISVEIANDIQQWVLIPQYDDDNVLQEIVSDDITLVMDPRIPQLGYRFFTRIGGHTIDDIRKYINAPIKEGTLRDYRILRYKLGVNEGFDDVPSQSYLPFECNGDYLSAISVRKGLYVAEELTTKIYSGRSTLSSKGRKRVMPIEFLCDKSEVMKRGVPPQTEIVTNVPNICGLLLNHIGIYGLAIFNCNKIFQCKNLIHAHSGLRLKTWRPQWWPQDMNPFMMDLNEYESMIEAQKKLFIAK